MKRDGIFDYANVEPWRKQVDGAEDIEVCHFGFVWSWVCKQADNEKWKQIC